MSEAAEVTILAADRSDNGVIISFNNGKTGFYPADLLYAHLPADAVTETPAEQARERQQPYSR